MIYNLTIKRYEASRHPLVFSIFGSDVLQRSILGPLFFLIQIKNLSNDIAALYVHGIYMLMFVHTSVGLEERTLKFY